MMIIMIHLVWFSILHHAAIEMRLMLFSELHWTRCMLCRLYITAGFVGCLGRIAAERSLGLSLRRLDNYYTIIFCYLAK